ncbi:acyl-CoA-binding domain-containing protein 4-like isoform X1 [Zingiber officinale]|uniref:acyl-CoA-binding domain-containing protein 4-like isoform X1 n=2 Tax=Zingiber officinale TaxID=94328 RepID=UPI001C4AF586|nr:acyl-CoA-binding domain-containing protein 4-like isoform X1 [Zingiber officinale]XP_042446206.1 acyl-CoA-binding domain-containing protein 4-like isoform X1 [Zingiber officinale]XP_042446207.1 acyl-CoA-binding domain-containing protein 4-like isoform X1 [Zingiber officinale]
MGLSRAIHNGDAGVRFKLPKGSSLGIAYVDDDRISHGRRRVRGTESSDIRSLCFPTGSTATGIGMEVSDLSGTMDVTAILASSPYDKWFALSTSGWCPSARYKHAAEFVNERLYVVGGSRNGRYLSDVQVFDFRTLRWSTLRLEVDKDGSRLDTVDQEKGFPAVAGHSLVNWENKLLVVAGFTKELLDYVTIWSIDLETNICSFVATYGKIPIARGGQSTTLVGSKLFMFGGEDRKRKLLNDLHTLDLTTMTWEEIGTKNASPAPRFDHSAAVYADQYLLIFGGSSHSICFNDLHLLDLRTMEWSQPQTQGAYVTPRGGHAGTLVNENWYIVGGGDNISGATETVALNISKLVWLITTNVGKRDPLASEGLTLCSAVLDGEKFIIAFGGYNGKYNNEIFVLKIKPKEPLQRRLLQSPAAAAAAASVTAAYAIITATDEKNIAMRNSVNPDVKSNEIENVQKLSAIDTDTLKAENKLLESRIMQARDENSRLQTKIDEMNTTHTELLKELQSVQNQLTAESARCLNLETHIAEMQKSLESFSSLEHEIDMLRHQKSQVDQEMVVVQKQRSGGVWQWLSGTADDV